MDRQLSDLMQMFFAMRQDETDGQNKSCGQNGQHGQNGPCGQNGQNPPNEPCNRDGQQRYDGESGHNGQSRYDGQSSHDRPGRYDGQSSHNGQSRPDGQYGTNTEYGKATFPGDEQMRMAPMFFMMLENMMPYLPPPQQKNVAAICQLMELRQRFTEYADEAARKHTPYGPDWRIELLKSLRQHIPAQKQRMIDILVKMIELQALIRMEEAAYGD